MKCPFCGNSESKVLDSRQIDDGAKIRRRRQCLACHKKFTTFEEVERIPLSVIKKDGSMELFGREKLILGILHSCEKRPVTRADVEEIVDNIEARLMNKREVSSGEIGELVMEYLKEKDKVAYVRFASVYKEFKDIETFYDELQKIRASEPKLEKQTAKKHS